MNYQWYPGHMTKAKRQMQEDLKLLDLINRAGTTVVMATHDREMVDSMRKRVIALEAGHIVRDQERGGYGYYGAL